MNQQASLCLNNVFGPTNVLAGCLWASSSAQEVDCGEWSTGETSELDRWKERWTSVGQTDGYFIT